MNAWTGPFVGFGPPLKIDPQLMMSAVCCWWSSAAANGLILVMELLQVKASIFRFFVNIHLGSGLRFGFNITAAAIFFALFSFAGL